MSWGRFLDQLGVAMRLVGVAIFAVALACSWQIYRDLEQAHLMEEKVTDASIAIGAAGSDLEKTLRDEQKAAGDQLTATAGTLKQTQTDLADADTAIKRLQATLDSINGTVGTLNGAIEDNSGRMLAIEDQAKRDLADLDTATSNASGAVSAATETIGQANKLLADPTIPDDLQQTHAVLVHLNATSAHVDAGTADLAAAIHRETRPASFAMKTASFILDGVSKAGAFLAGFIK